MSPATWHAHFGAVLRVFLTGGSGFLGSYVASELVRRGHETICLCRKGSDTTRLDAIRKATVVAAGDLRDHNEIGALLMGHRPQALCHLAWHGVFNTDRNAPEQFDNAKDAVALTAGAIEAGVEAIVSTGSQAEYGPLNRIAREADPLRPTTCYGRAKCETHDAIQRLCAEAGIRFAWLRVFSLYGPGDNEGWLIPSLIRTLLEGKNPPLTAGEQQWEFLYVDDAARAIVDVLECPAAIGDFNLGSGHARSLRCVIETVRDLVAPAASLGFGRIPYHHDQVMHLQADITRLRQAVGWQPTTDLADGLARTVSWYRSRRAGG